MLELGNKLAQARAYLAELTEEFPDEPRFLVAFARVLIALDERKQAEQVIAHLSELEPGSARVRAVCAGLSRKK